MGAKNIWDEINEEERKQVRFWLLNRYVSPIKGDLDKQELYLRQTNTITKTIWKLATPKVTMATLYEWFIGA